MKQQRKSMVKMLSLVLFVCMLATACSSNGNTTGNTTSGENNASDVNASNGEGQGTSGGNSDLAVLGENFQYDPNQPVNDGKEITIDFWVADQYDRIKSWTDDYSAIHPNVKFNLTKSPWGDYWKKLPLALQNNTGPDMFYAHEAYFFVLQNQTAPLPKDVFHYDDLVQDFQHVQAASVDGELYHVPMGMSTLGMYYNKKMWADAGLTEEDIPKTWDEFIEVAKKLTIVDDKGNFIQQGYNMEHVAEHTFRFLNYHKGYFFFDESGTKVTISHPEAIKTFEFMKRLVETEKIGEFTDGDNEEHFGHGKAAMIDNANWVGSYISSDFPDIDWGYFTYPTFDGKEPPAYGTANAEITPGVNINIDEKKKAVAFDFIKFILADDKQFMKLITECGCLPTKFNLRDHEFVVNNPILKEQAKISDRAIYLGYTPQAIYEKILRQTAADIFINGVSIQDALTKGETDINKSIEDSGINFYSTERQYKHSGEFHN